MAFSMAWPGDAVQGGAGDGQAHGMLARFRGELYRCFARRGDALFELCDAVLCRPERVHMLAELSLEPECRRGHGAVYDAVNAGRVQVARLRRALAGLPLPAWDDGRIRLAADVSNWLRPDAATSAERLFCHCYARGKGNAQMIPGWPYSVIAALEPGRTSWTLPLDAVRPGPADDAAAVTAAQVREVTGRIIAAGHWRDGDPDIVVIFDAGYDLTRLAWLLADLPVEVPGRLRSDRVMYFPAPPRVPGTNGRPLRHGAAFKLADQRSWPVPAAAAITETTRYGTARAMARGRLHQQLAGRAGWEDHDGELPIVEGTVIRLAVDRLPGDRNPEPLWLWSSRAGTSAAEVDRAWQARSSAASTSSTCSGSSSRLLACYLSFCLRLLFLGSARLTVLPTSWQVAGCRFFDPGGRPGPGLPGFGALAGQGSAWRMVRNPRRTRAGVSRPGGQGRCQGSRMSAARWRARRSWA